MRKYLRYFYVVLIFCLGCGDTLARGGAGTVTPCTATPPAQATAVGYTKLVACDTFATNQNIDVYNTSLPGFDWYAQQGIKGREVTPSKFINNDGTGVNLTGNNNNDTGIALSTAITNPNVSGAYIGHAWSGGFYAEVSLKLNPQSIATLGWPVFWFLSVNALTSADGSMYPQGTVFPQAEIDVGEFDVGATPPLFNLYDETGNTSGTVTGYGNTNNTPSLGSPTYSNYHTYGVLWVTAANNGGTGYVAFYFDNTLEETVTYSSSGAPSPTTCRNPYSGSITCPTGAFSDLDSDTLYAMIDTDWAGTGGASVMKPVYKNFHIWQLP
jgi:hypothetical protein